MFHKAMMTLLDGMDAGLAQPCNETIQMGRAAQHMSGASSMPGPGPDLDLELMLQG